MVSMKVSSITLFVSVSYTHLDVYKRQVRCCEPLESFLGGVLSYKKRIADRLMDCVSRPVCPNILLVRHIAVSFEQFTQREEISLGEETIASDRRAVIQPILLATFR